MQCVVFSPTPYKETAHPGPPARATKYVISARSPGHGHGSSRHGRHGARSRPASTLHVRSPQPAWPYTSPAPHTPQITRETHARATKPLTGVSSVLVLSISHHKDPLTGKA